MPPLAAATPPGNEAPPGRKYLHAHPCHKAGKAISLAGAGSVMPADLLSSKQYLRIFLSGERRAKPQRATVVATASGGLGPDGHGRADRADYAHVRLDGWAVCAQTGAPRLF